MLPDVGAFFITNQQQQEKGGKRTFSLCCNPFSHSHSPVIQMREKSDHWKQEVQDTGPEKEKKRKESKAAFQFVIPSFCSSDRQPERRKIQEHGRREIGKSFRLSPFENLMCMITAAHSHTHCHFDRNVDSEQNLSTSLSPVRFSSHDDSPGIRNQEREGKQEEERKAVEAGLH